MLLGSIQVPWQSSAVLSSCSWVLRKGASSHGSLLPLAPLSPCYNDIVKGLPEPSSVSPRSKPLVQASLTELPVVWAVRTCVFYALLQVGIAGRSAVSSSLPEDEDGGLFRQLARLYGRDEEAEQARELRRVRSRWQTTTKGTLKRKYRVPTKAEGRRLLNSISSLLSDDDSFRDATSHKGCQIRRENAHAESVCCHNVRALFDELPTPHLLIEITVFPVGPITNAHYGKAEKIESVLRTGNAI